MLICLSMRAIIYLANGPMSGCRFEAHLDQWPPPEKLIGEDIHPDLCGSYLLQPGVTDVESEPMTLIYRLRVDDDFNRVFRAWSTNKTLRMLAEGLAARQKR